MFIYYILTTVAQNFNLSDCQNPKKCRIMCGYDVQMLADNDLNCESFKQLGSLACWV